MAHHGPATPSSNAAAHPLIGHACFAGEVTQRHRWHQLPGRNHELADSPLRFGGSRLRGRSTLAETRYSPRIDTDELDRIWPQPEQIKDLIAVSRQNLRAFADLDVRHLVLCGVMGSISESKLWIVDAIGESRITYVRLTAERSTRRIPAPWSGDRKWL